MICPFCGNNVRELHKRSHIIPEWMYKGCYDENHNLISVSRRDKRASKQQKGLYSSFICKECEKQTEKYDHYGSLVLVDPWPAGTEHRFVKKEYIAETYEGKKLQYAKWKGLHFKKFQNFVFSIILRAYFAQMISDTPSLSQKHLQGILKIYRGMQIDDISYPIVLWECPKDDKYRNNVVIPFMFKSEGHHCISFSGGGYVFTVYASSHKKPSKVRNLSLKKDGSIYSVILPFRETGLYRQMLKMTKSLEKYPKNIS